MKLNDPTFIGERIPRKYLYAGEADKNIFLPSQDSILCVGHNGIALFNLRTYRITSFVDIDDIINVFCSPDQSVVSVHHGMDNKHRISHFRADTLSRIENPTNLSAKFYNPSCVISLGEDWVAAKDITDYVQIRNISNPDDSKPAQLTKLPLSADKLQYSVGNMVDCCEMKMDDQNKLWVATNNGLACITVNSLELLFDVIADKLSTFSIDLIKTIYLYALNPNFSWPQPVNRLATRYIKSRMRDTDEKKSAGPTSSIDEKASMELISSVLKIFEEQFAALNQQSFLQRFTYIRNLPNANIAELATKVKGNLDLFATTLFAENEAMKSQPQAPFAKALNATIYKMKQQSAFVMRLTQLEEKDRDKIINPHLFDLAVNLLTWGAKQEVKFYCDTVSIAEIRNVAHELVKHSVKKCDSSYDKTKAELLKIMQDSKSKIKDVVLLRELDFTCSSIDAGAGIIARIQIG